MTEAKGKGKEGRGEATPYKKIWLRRAPGKMLDVCSHSRRMQKRTEYSNPSEASGKQYVIVMLGLPSKFEWK